MINASGFTVHFHGDPSVGIFPTSWKVVGDFEFEDDPELEIFRKKLSEAFEYVCGEATEVMSFEEIEDMEDKLRNGED